MCFIWNSGSANTMSRIAAAFIILLLVGSVFHAYGEVKLLSPDAGWARYADTVFFTRDGGAHWSDITPRAPSVPKGATFGDIFFRDTSEGWAVASYREKTAPTLEAMRNAKTLYAILHTINSGESWSMTPLVYPALPNWIEETFAGPASIFFLDSTHGWMDMGYAGMMKPGKLLATEDGGQTWNWVNSPPFSGQIQFTSLNDGWLINSWGGDELYATHDGAKSWQEVSLTPPPDVRATDRSLFYMPQFQDSRVGYLPVKYMGPFGTPSKLVVYTTQSNGKIWRVLKRFQIPADIAFALTDSVLILPVETKIGELSTTSVSESDHNQTDTNASARAVLSFSFFDRNNGWAQTSNTLYDTTDGGTSWDIITPPQLSPLPHVTIVAPSASASGR